MQHSNHPFIWHPFTQMKTADPPLEVVRASGPMLYTKDGKAYLDAISSWWVNLHGHCHPQIADAISRQAHQLEQVIFAGFIHAPAIELADTLMPLLPAHFAKLFFSDDGSTSVEVALKMALQFWHNQGKGHKTRIIALEQAYHGDTFGAMSVAERNAFNAAFSPLLFEVHRLPLPHAGNISEVLRQLDDWLSTGEVAAMIVEPLVQGAAGMQMYEARYLDQLFTAVHRAGALCIADEVMTGFGRTGKLFAVEYLQEQPDIICLSKGITGGFLPLGVTVCTQDIYDAFYQDDKLKTFFHGHSYTANPLACAAAVASLKLLQDASCRNRIAAITQSHRAFATSLQGHPFIKDIRHLGTILAIELGTPESSSYFNSIQQAAYRYYLQRGIYLRPLGNVVYLMPPYCITGAELEQVYAVIRDSLDWLMSEQ